MRDAVWPALPYEEWKDTYATLHMWTQVVGKVALKTAPPLNHGWGIALQLGARGLVTRLLRLGGRTFTMELDFLSHELAIRTSDGAAASLPLVPRTVAEFYREVMRLLDGLGLGLTISTLPSEVPDPIRFEDDVVHRSYDPEYANRFWRILVASERVLSACRLSFLGKCSPVHFFWGGFDLAVTRFSGRPAPPREGPEFMRDAYSHEVISHGWWPGSGPLLEPAYYAYSVPNPEGFSDATVKPSAAYWHREMGEFILPYEAVRTAPDPDALLAEFVDSTYEAGATLARWDRAALERAGFGL
jgi:hypothetical protein